MKKYTVIDCKNIKFNFRTNMLELNDSDKDKMLLTILIWITITLTLFFMSVKAIEQIINIIKSLQF